MTIYFREVVYLEYQDYHMLNKVVKLQDYQSLMDILAGLIGISRIRILYYSDIYLIEHVTSAWYFNEL